MEEQIIIGSWLLGYNLNDIPVLNAEDFGKYEEIVRMIKSGVREPFTISTKLNIRITELTEMTTAYENYLYKNAYANMIKAKTNRYLSTLTAETPLSEIQEHLKELQQLTNNGDVEPEHDLANNYLKDVEERQNNKPIRYGIADLDRIMGGVRKKELTTIAARPSVGKSAFVLKAALNIASQGKKVLFFPLEMSTTQTVERIVQMRLNVNQERLRSGNLSKDEWSKMSINLDYINKIEKAKNFLIFEGVSNLTTIKQLVDKYKPYAIVIDQLTQLKDNKTFNSVRERFSYMTSELKAMSMINDMAVLLACQINRSLQGSEPTMDNLKESGSIEEDSDNIIILHRVKDDSTDMPHLLSESTRPVLTKVEKQRNGPTGSLMTIFKSDRFTFYGVEENAWKR